MILVLVILVLVAEAVTVVIHRRELWPLLR